MKKNIPDYADKIRFRYIDGLRYAINYLYNLEYKNIGKNIEFKYDEINSFIKVVDAYKFNMLNNKSRNVIKEIGRRINYILEQLNIDFKYV